MWPCTAKLAEEKWKYADLDQENGFRSAQFESVGVTGFRMIRPSGLLLVVPHVFGVPVSVLWVGLQRSK